MYSILLLGFAAIRTAHAWGDLGHKTVAYVAQNFVSDETREWAQNILNDTSDDYLAKIANYSDMYRGSHPWSAPFHFIDAPDVVEKPPVACAIHFPIDCGNEGCIITAIANYTERVRNRGIVPISAWEVKLALMMIVHFLGDITQPLHTELYDKGATQLQVKWKGNQIHNGLHAVWDSEVAQEAHGESSLEHAKAWADDLTREIESGIYNVVRASWIVGLDVDDAEGSAVIMANDSNRLVCLAVMPEGADALANQELYPEYYHGVIDTVELQIAKGGYRLAKWLDALSPGGEAREWQQGLVVQPHSVLKKRE